MKHTEKVKASTDLPMLNFPQYAYKQITKEKYVRDT